MLLNFLIPDKYTATINQVHLSSIFYQNLPKDHGCYICKIKLIVYIVRDNSIENFCRNMKLG